MTLPITSIRLDFQPAECMDEEKIHGFAQALRDGEALPPVTVYFDGKVYWLYDGFHRLAATSKVGKREIDAEIIHGTYADMEARWREGLEAIKAELAKWAAKKGSARRRGPGTCGIWDQGHRSSGRLPFVR